MSYRMQVDSVKDLKAMRARLVAEMQRDLVPHLEDHTITPAMRTRFDDLNNRITELTSAISAKKSGEKMAKKMSKTGKTPYRGDERTEGKPNELLSPDQSFATWAKRAAENGVRGTTASGTDRDVNRYWAERMGLSKPTMETRTLGEDTTSGSGAGQSIVPIEFSTTFIDIIRPKLILSQAGVQMMPMTTEHYNLPQYLSDVAPVYLAENTANSIDALPQFAPIAFLATGAYQDITLMSRQIAEDTNQEGGLAGLLQETIGQKYARLIDQTGLYGTSGNSGNPGLVNEAGLLTSGTAAPAGFGTDGGSPVNWSQLSVAAEDIRSNNGEPSAMVMHPKALGTYSRLVDTLGQPMRMTPDIADIPILDSSTLLTDEAQGTGTNLTSIYMGDWARMIVGMRVDLQVTVLRERYADIGQIGLWSYIRFSVRTTHPELFYRLTGMIYS
jgi:HK97 family phage major capsid protein